jgi:hypothetical protein
VPILDDEQFERYLKQFRPVVPEPLPASSRQPAPRLPFGFAAWAVAAAAIIIAAVLIFRFWPRAVPQVDTAILTAAEQPANQQPLTLATANALLANSPSPKAAFDQLAFHSQSTQLPKDKQSALAVLSQDNNKL